MSLGVLPRPSSLATSYAQNYLSHPGLEWAEPRNTFLPKRNTDELMKEIDDEWTATKDDKMALIEELRLFQANMSEKSGGCQPGRNVDLQKCSMADVFKAIEGATARSKSRNRASSHKFICSIGKHAPILKQWITLLPNGDYGSAICGAFTILLEATERIYSVDHLVYEWLSKISTAIQKAGDFIDIYREQQPLDLIKKGVDLYRSVLVALTDCVKYSRKNSSKREQTRRFFGSLLKGDAYQRSLKDNIGKVTENVTAVNDQAKMCQHRRILGIYEILIEKERREWSEGTASPISAKERQSIEVFNNLKGLLDSHGWLDRKGLLRETVEEMPPKQPRKKKEAQKEIEPMDLSPELDPHKPQAISAEDLLNLIAYNTFTSVQDLQDAIHCTLSSEGTHLVAQAVKSDELRKFLRTPTISSAIAIHANSSDTSDLSPLSYLSAQLTQLLFSVEAPIVLVYFCSLHAEAWNPRASATRLIATLLGQLLSYPSLNFDLSFIDDEVAQLLEDDDFPQLVQVFLSLLHQLSSEASVFCFIDEVSVYETPERQGDIRKLLATFVRQVIQKQEEDGLPAFKLLLTDGTSSMVGETIGAANVLDLNEDWDGDDGDEVDVTDVVGGMFE